MSLLPSQIAGCDRHYDREPVTLPGDSCASWITRGSNFVVAVSRVQAGDTLRRDNPDEYVLLLPPDMPGFTVQVQAAGESLLAGSDSLSIVPPGPSQIQAQADGMLVRIFSSDVADVLALAFNHQTYAVPNPAVAPLQAWPEPRGGYRLRHYRLAEYIGEGSQMRVFCTRKLMVNPLVVRRVPRDIHKLSPHSHADFEQGSLALAGTYVHHLRYPWVPDMDFWRADEALQASSPSLLVVPPGVVHTSRNIDAPGVLVDIFAPPRLDFAKRGIVCNADEYPMPE